MRLVDGADAIRGDLPVGATTRVDVPTGAGSNLGTTVHRLSTIQHARNEVIAMLQGVPGIPVTIGGDCSADLGAVQHVTAGGDVAVVWFDAHADLNTAESSPSGSFGGMVLRTVLGDGPAEIVAARPVDARHVVLAGARAMDDAESDFIDESGLVHLSPDALTRESLTTALEATGATSIYVHIDLDVLDPAEFACVGAPEPFGITLAELIELVGTCRAVLPLAGAGITGFAPASPEAASDDLPAILRIIGALTKAS